MRILFFSDRYGYNFMSIKRTIEEELVSRGIYVVYRDHNYIRSIRHIIDSTKPDQIWLVHSGLTLPCDKKEIKQPVIGFGFSDPHYFSPSRLKSYDAYITAHYGTYMKYKHLLPILFSPDPYSSTYFRKLDVEKAMDISFIGRAVHPRFKNTTIRMEIIDKLRKDTSFNIHVFGRGWAIHENNHEQIVGMPLVKAINSSRIGLDIQDGSYSLSERVFHYGGCGVPVITWGSSEVDKVFVRDKEILTYNSYDELKDKLVYYIRSQDELEQIGKAVHERCLNECGVNHRIDNILAFLEGVSK